MEWSRVEYAWVNLEMGCHCCRKEAEEKSQQSLPSKRQQPLLVEETGERLLHDLKSLRDNMKAPKLSTTSTSLWSLKDFHLYESFLTALLQQAETLQQSPAIHILSLPVEGVSPEELRQRYEEMERFIQELRGLHEPGELPDAEWLEAVKQLVGKKNLFLTCKQRYEQLKQQFYAYQSAVEELNNAEEACTKLDISHLNDELSTVQRETGEVLTGYCTVIQLTEKVFQTISFLSRVALGMQARMDVMSGRALPNSNGGVHVGDDLEMEIVDRNRVTAE